MANLKDEVIKADKGNADIIHLDVMDGHFAPNITFGFTTIKALRRYTNLPFDAHLMITNPLKYLDKFLDAGCDIISVHVEVCNKDDLDQVISKVKDKNKKVGIAINPNTELPDYVIDKLDELYLMNVMSVYPGFSGQKLIPETLVKMRRIHEMLKDMNKQVIIEADGGVDENNIMDVVRAGAEIIVAGSAVYSKDDVSKAINDLRANAKQALEVM
ncbi:MAG: ribulose-phosphate 3-epimerase [Candidatus Nitrosocaldaceae archaeon]|nr:MAG: ribulose-phosphate 3-epimerase [Candidatus Nitrosocaldaceae archaeon]